MVKLLLLTVPDAERILLLCSITFVAAVVCVSTYPDPEAKDVMLSLLVVFVLMASEIIEDPLTLVAALELLAASFVVCGLQVE